MAQITTLTESSENGAQRVFCVKWFDENLILSAGWNNKLTIWDTRTHFHCREMLGPHICGDSVSIRNNYIVSGSYHIHDQLQVWALDSGRNIFTTSLNFNGKKCMPYAVEFCKTEGTVFAIGGTGTSEINFYDAATLNQVAVIGNINKIVYSIHSSTNKLAVAVGNTVKIYSI